jgi:ketosteroid isomerase-like protein
VIAPVIASVLLTFASALAAHDLFLRAHSYFIEPNTAVEIMVLNGTFDESEGAVERDRVRDISVVGPHGTTHPDTGAWRPQGDTTYLRLRTRESGTYVVGASVLPRALALSADDFNRYLESDGIPDILEARRRDGELGKPARERYSKHVKAMLQVGEHRSTEFDAVLGYPAELIPIENPYALTVDDTLALRTLVDGRPVSDQLVLAGGRNSANQSIPEQAARTDSEGIVRVALDQAGQWYVKFIHMVRVQSEPDLDYESKWATLTFEVRARDSAPPSQDSAAVAAVIDRFHRALAAGDSADAAMLLLPDVVILESGGIETREEYLGGHLRGDIAFAQAVPRERGAIAVRIHGDVGLATSTSVSRGEYRGRAVNSAGAELMVLRRTPEGWRIEAIHWSSRPLRS